MTPPRVYTTCDWGGVPVDTSRLTRAKATGSVVHHTAGANANTFADMAREIDRGKRLMQSIQSYHRNQNRWMDTGYHFVITRSGLIYEGRTGSYAAALTGRVVPGAHAGNNTANRRYYGVCLEGTYTAQDPPPAQWEALVELLAWLSFWAENQSADIYGHRRYRATECPGQKVWSRLPALRAEVREVKLKIMDAA